MLKFICLNNIRLFMQKTVPSLCPNKASMECMLTVKFKGNQYTIKDALCIFIIYLLYVQFCTFMYLLLLQRVTCWIFHQSIISIKYEDFLNGWYSCPGCIIIHPAQVTRPVHQRLCICIAKHLSF